MTTQAERLARIEALVEGIAKTVDKSGDEIAKLREEVQADKAELAALKNRGIGLLIGVGALSGTLGAALSKAWQGLFGG